MGLGDPPPNQTGTGGRVAADDTATLRSVAHDLQRLAGVVASLAGVPAKDSDDD
jgi:hypothetical protein